ncbi:hypothetical protein QAD02_015415 [Eretmocerus hayati]|uniref:Uncharacterized protein n=1 Tax=Eretmocerus hayati TaxID=131215 RepID=A0ACC2P869_9HYME|nr:hypothetical protein QAD02_015415 [Eretmocerus hayati]
MVEELYDDKTSENISNASHTVIEENIKFARLLSYLVMAGYGFIATSIPLKILVSYLTGGVDERKFIIPAAFPWNGRESPLYELTVITQFVTTSAAVYGCAVIEGQLAFLVRKETSRLYQNATKTCSHGRQ